MSVQLSHVGSRWGGLGSGRVSWGQLGEARAQQGPRRGEGAKPQAGRPTNGPEAHGQSWDWGTQAEPQGVYGNREKVCRQRPLGQDRTHLQSQPRGPVRISLSPVPDRL